MNRQLGGVLSLNGVVISDRTEWTDLPWHISVTFTLKSTHTFILESTARGLRGEAALT
jgi:hypothetical protein